MHLVSLGRALAVLGILSGCARQAAPVPAPAAASEVVLRLPALDFAAADDALLPLTGWLAGAEMVLLGEAHHGDAEGIAATVRLVRFLHERMGFDLLALEADLYGCARAWEGLVRGDAAAAELCAFRKDKLSQAAAPFWHYLAERARSGRPLELAGFDCQPASEGSRTHLLAELDALFSAEPGVLDGESWQRARSAIDKLSHYTPRSSETEHLADRTALEALAAGLHALTPSATLHRERLALLRQLGASLVADEAQEWAFQQAEPLGPGYHRSFNERDAQMARNLLWLRKREPGRRIVVWAATAHLVRSLASIPAAEAELFEPMGKHIARALGPRAVHIATLNGAGRLALPGDEPFALSAAPAGFLEDELKRRAFGPRALVDLRRPSEATRWLDEPRPARWYLTKRPPRAVAERARDVADIILFLEEARPNAAVKAPRGAP
jgi:erythromycin esterase